MPRKKKDIHYIYKTTCNVTNRYYIGMHSTTNINDGYMGSGKRLRRSIRKHGKNNHKREILEFFDTRELLVEAEIEAITPDMIDDKDCMNLMSGGNGGFISEEQQRHRSQCAGKALHEKLRNDEDFRKEHLKKLSMSVQKAMDDGKMKTWKDNYDWNGKFHSKETKQKMSESSKGIGKGSTNSQFGTCWITNGKESKKIMKGDDIPEGWLLGR